MSMTSYDMISDIRVLMLSEEIKQLKQFVRDLNKKVIYFESVLDKHESSRKENEENQENHENHENHENQENQESKENESNENRWKWTRWMTAVASTSILFMFYYQKK
jgi:hypothetical protein